MVLRRTKPAGPDRRRDRILFGVTIDYQLRYHSGLYERLAQAGKSVHIVTSPGTEFTSLCQTKAITGHPLPMHRNPSPLGDLRSLCQWIRVLLVVRPHTVVLGTPKAALLGLLAARLCGVPRRVYEMHGLRLQTAKGGARMLLRFLEAVTCGVANEVVVVSRSLEQAALEEGVVTRGGALVIGEGSPNGVDVEHFARASTNESEKGHLRKRLGLDPKLPTVVFVGRLTADKGLANLADAMELLSNEQVKCQLLIVGPVDDENSRADLARLAAAVPTIAAGFVEDTAPYIALGSVMCLPSRREGLSTVVLEAFAAGVPVVATQATGIVDLVADGITGWSVPIDEPRELAAALREAISMNKTAKAARITAAKRMVESKFDRDVVQRHWVHFLTSVPQ